VYAINTQQQLTDTAHLQLMYSIVDISHITRHSEVVTRWTRHKSEKTRQWTHDF